MNKGYSRGSGGDSGDDGSARGGNDGSCHAASAFCERCSFCGWFVRGNELRRTVAGDLACSSCDQDICPRCHEGIGSERSALCAPCLDVLGYLRLVDESLCQVLRLCLGDGSTVVGMFVAIFLHEGQVKITLHIPRELYKDPGGGEHIRWDISQVPLNHVRSVERYEPLLEEEETVSAEELRQILHWMEEDRKVTALEKVARVPERVSSSPWADVDWEGDDDSEEDEDDDPDDDEDTEGWDDDAEYHDDILDESLNERVESVRKESKRLDVLLDKALGKLKKLKGSDEAQAHDEIDRLLDISMEVDDAVILLLNTLMAEFEEEDKRREGGEGLTRREARDKLLKVHGLVSEAEKLMFELRALVDGVLSR